MHHTVTNMEFFTFSVSTKNTYQIIDLCTLLDHPICTRIKSMECHPLPRGKVRAQSAVFGGIIPHSYSSNHQLVTALGDGSDSHC